MDFYFPDPEAPGFNADDVYASWERVMQEDEAVHVQWQKGMQSRRFDTGRLAVRHEKTIHEFQAWQENLSIPQLAPRQTQSADLFSGTKRRACYWTFNDESFNGNTPALPTISNTGGSR
jgi:hypothetical protein